MSKKNRFLNIPYILNTIAIKATALRLRLVNGSYPYTYFINKTIDSNSLKYQLNYHEEYHALTYLDYQKALKLHDGTHSITQQLILGLIYFNDLIKNSELNEKHLIDLSLELKSKAVTADDKMIFYIDEDYHRFDLTGRYYSGIVQGKAASFFLRCYALTKDEKYKSWAKKCLLAAWIPVEEGGTLIQLPNNNIWIEEYPSSKPSMVLNGFLFYIIGLAEYLTFEHDDHLKSNLDICLESVVNWLPHYKVGNDLLYSMYRWNLCNVHYTGIMKYQFEHLYLLTKMPIFEKYMEFTDSITNWNSFENIT